jgi:O-antigen/teichoic acid export membrane protein
MILRFWIIGAGCVFAFVFLIMLLSGAAAGAAAVWGAVMAIVVSSIATAGYARRRRDLRGDRHGG